MTEDFQQAVRRGLLSLQRETEQLGIGVKRERSLHAILKYWMEPDEALHERELPDTGQIADIFDGERVTEVQTGSFTALRKKLERMLPRYPVTVVYPLPRTKRLIWVEEDGSLSDPHLSPKKGQPWDAFDQLAYVAPLLGHPHLTVRLVLLDLDEYRRRDGWGREGKRGSHRLERIPRLDEKALPPALWELQSAEDYGRLLPPDLPSSFTSVDLKEALRRSVKQTQKAIYVLHKRGAIVRKGKIGHAYIYKRIVDCAENNAEKQ